MFDFMFEVVFPAGGDKAFEKIRPSDIVLQGCDELDCWTLSYVVQGLFIPDPIFDRDDKC